ncbi:MAG: DsrE family protein [Euryarchaeota archaeon]|nr:DsrE family protein [Euryarchaeota archaeon]
MAEVKRVLLLLKNMVYESTSPLETLRFAKYYRKKGLDVIVILWGPMGVVLGKAGKHRGAPIYDAKIGECIELGVEFKCCQLAADIIGMDASELIPEIEMIESHVVAELFLEYQSEGELIISL